MLQHVCFVRVLDTVKECDTTGQCYMKVKDYPVVVLSLFIIIHWCRLDAQRQVVIRTIHTGCSCKTLPCHLMTIRSCVQDDTHQSDAT